MKSHLALSSLLVITGYAVVDVARYAGVSLPTFLNAQNALSAFVLLSLALVVLSDYGRKVRPIALPARTWTPHVRRHLRPAHGSIAAAQRHIYAIRRGSEAARLAPAPKIVIFPRNLSARQDRAA